MCFIPDNVIFNTSRLPLVNFSGKIQKISYTDGQYSSADYKESDLTSQYLPIISVPEMNNGVIYFMCQATGYKQTSNKELPGTAQAFSKLLPLTQFNGTKDTASAEQQLPMFGILNIEGTSETTNASLQLVRILNVQSGKKKPIYNSSNNFSKDALELEYISQNDGDYIQRRFGIWGKNDTNTIVTFTL